MRLLLLVVALLPVRQLIDWCVNGVMTARPVGFERVLRASPAPAACR